MTSHFRLSLFPLMAMKHATRNLVSNSESFRSAFLPTCAYNCSPVSKFQTSILTLCIYKSEIRKRFFMLVTELWWQVVSSCNIKFKRICFAQIKVVCFIATVLLSGSTSCEWFWTTNLLNISHFIVSYQFCALLFIYLFTLMMM